MADASGDVLHPAFCARMVLPELTVSCGRASVPVTANRVSEGPTPRMPRSNEPMVQATVNGIQSRSGDQAFGLMHSGARSVIYTPGAEGTLGARYTDLETGNVTMTKVYVE